MKVHFYKYQATGNDFVVIDNRSGRYSLSTDQVRQICNRRFGIGADGLMLIENDAELHFNLVYYNSDGSQSLCGNGSRAAVRFASLLGVVNGKALFNAYDGRHAAEITGETVRLKMNDVAVIRKRGGEYFINTGSPHVVRFVTNVREYPVYDEGKAIRYSDAYKPGGTNANFVELLPDNALFVRTYERGVEDETLSCGTGVVASALAASFEGCRSPVRILAPGGELSVEFRYRQPSAPGQYGTFTDVFLIGPAKLVFEGDLEL